MFVLRMHQKWTMLKPESCLSLSSSSSELEIISFSAVSGCEGSSVKPVVDIPWVVTGGDVTSNDQALTTSDPDNDAGTGELRSIKSSSEPSAGGETAPHPANKDKKFREEALV